MRSASSRDVGAPPLMNRMTAGSESSATSRSTSWSDSSRSSNRSVSTLAPVSELFVLGAVVVEAVGRGLARPVVAERPVGLLARVLLVEDCDAVAEVEHRHDVERLTRMRGVLDARFELATERLEDAAHDHLLLRRQ